MRTDTQTSTAADALDAEMAARLFTQARTHARFDARPVPQALLRRLYELASRGPTSMNCQSARYVFVASAAAAAPGALAVHRSARACGPA